MRLHHIFPIFCLTAITIFASTGCIKDTVPVVVSDDEAAAMVAGSVCRDVQGLFTEVKEAAARTNSAIANLNACNFSKDTSFSRSQLVSLPSYSYTLRYNYYVQCSNFLPSIVNFSVTHNGNYETLRLKSNGNGNGAWQITDVLPTSTAFTIDYTRNGNATYSRNKKTFSTDLRCTLAGVKVNRLTQALEGGVITFTITGSSSTTTNYTFAGTITITDNNTATLQIGARTFTLNLQTGALQ
jgi:hypothetical protein